MKQNEKPLTPAQIKQLEKEKLDKKLTGQTINKNDRDTKPKR